MNLSDLLLFRQWLNNWENSMTLDRKFIKQATEIRVEVDKQIWGKYVSKETPWGDCYKMYVDNNFEKTLQELFKDESHDSDPS